MKKVLFCLLSFFFFLSVSFAHVENAQFVGGTGGSKILELNVTEDKVDTNGVIYDKNASLVYEITYTNVSSTDKAVTDVKLPDTDIVLSYDFSDIDKNLVIKPGETVKFQYSIKALDNMTYEELSNLNENAQAELIFSSVDVSNPDTKDIVVMLLLTLVASVVIFRFVKDKRVFYACFIISAFLLSLNFSKKVIADDYEIVNINTGIKYIFSNLAPSCANLDYEGDFCIDWKEYGNRDKVNYLVMTDTKDMTDTYKIEDVSFTLQDTYDVSEQQNEDVILGVYLADTEEESYLFLIGQDDGVIVPKDASYQFTSYDSVNNKNEYDFHYVKYLDFSHFYSNKTTNMEYMLVGLGTQVNMEYYDLSGFETSNVTNMKGMFTGFGEATKNLNLDISNFDTSNVTDMSWMFWEAAFESEKVNLDLSNFDTSEVTDMSYMFYNFGHHAKDIYLNVDDLDTSNVTNMSFMFRDFAVFADELYFDISNFDVSKVETMSGMFYDFNVIGYAVSKIDYFKDWDTSSLIKMDGMFAVNIFVDYGVDYEPQFMTIDLTGFDTAKVTDMSSLFSWNYYLNNLILPEDFNTSNVENMSAMFNCTSLEDLSFIKDFDTSKVVDIGHMFQGFDGTELDLSSWDVSKVENIDTIFNNCNKLTTLNLRGWDLSNLKDSGSAFRLLDSMDYLDLSYLDFSKSEDYSYMFMGDTNSYSSVFDLSGTDWNENAKVDGMFYNIKGSTIYVKDEKAKAFIEKQAPDCTVLIKE